MARYTNKAISECETVKEKGAKNSESPKMAAVAEIDAGSQSYRGEIPLGTASETEEEKERGSKGQANQGNQKEMTDHHILIQHHKDRVGFDSSWPAQAKAVQTLLKHFSKEDCIAYYDFQVMQLQPNGKRTSVSWLTVQTKIADWALAGKPKTPADAERKRDQVGRGDEEPEEWTPDCKECKDVGMIWTVGKAEDCTKCVSLAA